MKSTSLNRRQAEGWLVSLAGAALAGVGIGRFVRGDPARKRAKQEEGRESRWHVPEIRRTPVVILPASDLKATVPTSRLRELLMTLAPCW